MPIYEFKCLECNDCLELLVMNSEDVVDLKCKSCNSRELERIISSTSYAMGSSTGESTGVTSQSRACSGGSCTTYDIPGHSR